MSVSTTGRAVAPTLRPRGLSLLLGRVAACRVPLTAFVASRVLVYLTGVIGALVMHKHDAPAARATRQALGPVGAALAGSVDRFDAGYYLQIAAHGFGPASAGRTAFFPLYPLLIRAGTPVLGSGVLAGAAISAAAFAGALVVVHRLTEIELGARTAKATVWLLALAPLSFFFTAVYSESLFLLLIAGAIFAARRDRWWLACLLGSLSVLTRPEGILLGLVLLIERARVQRRIDIRLLGVLALPATLLAYMGVMASMGYGWLAPMRAERNWDHTFVGPLGAVLAGAWAALRGGARLATGAPVLHPTLDGPLSAPAQSVVLLAVLVVVVAALALCWRRLSPTYFAYAGAALLLILSSPVVGQPLLSIDRYTLTVFPLWMAGADWLVRRRLLAPALALGTALLVFYTLAFSSWAFVA